MELDRPEFKSCPAAYQPCDLEDLFIFLSLGFFIYKTGTLITLPCKTYEELMTSHLQMAWHSAQHLEGALSPAQQPWSSRTPTRSDLVTPAPCSPVQDTAPICQPWDLLLSLETGDRTFPLWKNLPTLKKSHPSLAEGVPTVAWGLNRRKGFGIQTQSSLKLF